MESHESADIMCVEVQINSVSSPDKEENSSLLGSVKKRTKRKLYDVEVREKTPKKLRSADSNRELSHCDSSNDGSRHRSKKAKDRVRSRKNNVNMDPTELKNVLDGMDDEINDVLEETAEKNRLTAANVKNILRHVITNEYVLAMVRNTMKAENSEDGDFEEAVFEPKLTRSKVKELREKQHILPWPMSTPVKQPESATKALLEEEFPDESSSDEDYKPNEEECPSEEDNLIGSPKSTDLDSSICGKPASPIPKVADADDDIGLVIALPEPEPILHEEENTEVDKIALRTRSKLPLKDTPLEVIEASFIAPDISEDMYDTNCDDEEWQKFLQEYRALDTIVAVEKLDEEPDNADDDPEYNVLDDDDIPDELDLRYDNNVKITRKELNALIAEMLETAQVELNDVENDGDADEDEEDTETQPRIETPIMDVVDDGFVENVRTQWMTNEERLRLEEQMRMYVQILTQSFLLSFGIPELNYLNVSCKLFLDEIKMFASLPCAVNESSAFCAHNLDGALEIVNYFENNKAKIHMRTNITNTRKQLPGIASILVKKTLYTSPVFMYPDLLPICGFFRTSESKKPIFTNAEDNLIAIGLEEFSFSSTPVYYIQTLLMPPKTEYQIKLRIKNSKAARCSAGNPIKYFYQHRRAPPFSRTIRPFDPNNVKAPKHHPTEILPTWMRSMCTPAVSTNSLPILPKIPKTPYKPATLIKKRTFNHKTLSKPGYRVLLPRSSHFSPLRQISPILKKYNQKRRALSVVPMCNTSRVRKNTQGLKQLAIKPLISPIPVIKKEDIIEGNTVGSTIVISYNHEAKTVRSDATMMNCEKAVQGASDTAYLVNAETAGTSECTPDLSVNECDIPVELEAVDEVDEEIIDDEPELTHQDSTVTSNIINKKQSANKKKNKQQRDLESSLALLQPNLVENDPKREERETLFANSYLLRVTEALKENSDIQEKFLKTLCKYQHNAKSPVKIYLEMKEILKDYPALADDFIAFLRPEQARDCGKYKEYLILSKIRAFIRKVEVHFSNQPQHLLKILRTIAQFKQQSSISSVEVLSTLQPLLKNQSHLVEELTNLLPDMAPPESLMTDFQEVTIPNSDDDNSSVDSCEEILIPESTDPYGGKDCPCDCHTSSTEVRVVNKTRHCVKCGVKFMDGKVYIQTGKVLKPAQVVYRNVPPEPSKVSNDSKAMTKSKSNCSPSTKISVATEQSSKSEVPQTKKDPVKVPSGVQQPPVLSEEPVPSTSKLPCDVFEDTVFPALPVSQNKKSVPSDFSQLKEVIGHTNDKDGSPNGKSSDNLTEATNPAEQAKQSQISTAKQKASWSRDEDKLIIYNCQRFGITEKAFLTSSSTLKSRSSEEVQERFMHLMNLLSQEFKL